MSASVYLYFTYFYVPGTAPTRLVGTAYNCTHEVPGTYKSVVAQYMYFKTYRAR